jgi:hypothetical protein
MRDYGKVHTSFWSSATIRGMTEDGRMLALYLMTSPHTTITGTFRLPDGYVCEDMGWTSQRVSKGFTELFAKGFGNRCETTKWVWIRKHLEWNPPENPNQRKAAVKLIHSIPEECAWKTDFIGVCVTLLDVDPEDFENPCETVTEPFLNQNQDKEQEQEQEQKQNGHQTVVPTDVDVVFNHWRQVHSHPRSQLDEKRRKVIRVALKSYSPEQLCLAIAGYKNSPFHMGKNDRSAVFDDIGLLLRDAEHVDAGLKFAEQGAPEKWT